MSFTIYHQLKQYPLNKIQKAVDAINAIATQDEVKGMQIKAELQVQTHKFILHVGNPGFSPWADMLSIGIRIGEELNKPYVYVEMPKTS